MIKKKSVENGTYFIDIKQTFERESPNGIIGNELVLEHLHPNFSGYFIMANCYFDAILKSGIIPQTPEEYTTEQFRADYPFTPVDSLKGVFEIALLKEYWPFMEKAHESISNHGTEEARIAGGLAVNQYSWEKAMTMLYDYYIKTGNKAGVLKISEALALEYPYEISYNHEAAVIAAELFIYQKAILYSRHEFQLKPSFELARNIFLTHLKADQPEQTLPFINYAIANNNGEFDMVLFKKIVNQVIEAKGKLEKSSADINLLKEIAGLYIQLGNSTGADKYLNKIKAKDPGFQIQKFVRKFE